MEEFGFGMFDDLLEGERNPLEIDDFEDEQDYKRQLKEKKLNIYEPSHGVTRLHSAIQRGKQIEINALLELYEEDFHKVRDHLMAKYQWNAEDKIWLKKTVLVASSEEQCQNVKNLENWQVDRADLRRAVFVLLQHPVKSEDVAVLHPNEASRSAVAKLITTLIPNGFLTWNFVSTNGFMETLMQVAASKGLKRVINRLYELGAPIAVPGHNPLMQAIRNYRKEIVNWLLTEHFDHFDCTLRDCEQHNALIAAMLKNVAPLFDLVLEKMIAYRKKYFNESDEKAFQEIFRLENEKYEYTSIFEYIRRDGPVFVNVEHAIQKYKLKLSHQWRKYIVLGRLIECKIALNYCFEGIRNNPQLLRLKENETTTILHQLVSEGHLDFVRKMYTMHPDVKIYFNDDQAFEVLRKAINNRCRETILFVLEHHGDFLKSDMGKFRDQIVCCSYYSKEFYESRGDLLVECFPEFQEDVLESKAKALSEVCNYGLEASFATANIYVADIEKLPKPYSTVRGSFGETLLHWAVYKDDKELFVRMLEGGCELDTLDNGRNHPVHLVKSDEMLDLIIDRHPDGRNIIQRTNNDGCTVLHKICNHYISIDPHIALLEKLIMYGADVHQLNNHGESVVFFVSNSYLLDVLRNHGVQLDVVNKYGETALERHLVNYNVCVARSLLINLHDQPSFKQHAHKYLAPMMRYNRDFFSCDYQKFLEDHPESARTMFDCVCDHSREEASRLFSKACACAFNYILEMFLSGNYDLDYNYKKYHGITPLIDLLNYMEEPNLHIVKQLLAKGVVDVHVKNDWGMDALLTLVGGFRRATCHGHGLETVQLLLDHGASIHTSDEDGNTSLHLAFADGEMELVEFLVQNGANLGSVNSHGMRPYERASALDQELFYFYSGGC